MLLGGRGCGGPIYSVRCTGHRNIFYSLQLSVMTIRLVTFFQSWRYYWGSFFPKFPGAFSKSLRETAAEKTTVERELQRSLLISRRSDACSRSSDATERGPRSERRDHSPGFHDLGEAEREADPAGEAGGSPAMVRRRSHENVFEKATKSCGLKFVSRWDSHAEMRGR